MDHPPARLCGPVSRRDSSGEVNRDRRSVMTRWIAVMLAVIGVAGARQVKAQESVSGPGTVVVTIIPGGATFFTEGKDSKGPSFGNYGLGGSVEVNFNPYV